MRRPLRILPAADADIDSAAFYIAQESEEQALRFYDAIDETFKRLAEHPERWPLYELDHARLANVRRCFVAGFRNHLVFYHIVENVVEVIRVLHGARDIPSILQDPTTD